MTDLRTAAQMALDALEEYEDGQKVYFDDEIEALRAALAQTEQEPQYKLICPTCKADRTKVDCQGNRMNCGLKFEAFGTQQLYTAPPQREWHGLTDEEIDDMMPYVDNEFDGLENHDFARAIEAKLKEKNT